MDPAQSTWWTLCLSLLERTRDAVRTSPLWFISCTAVFYVPVIAFKLLDPVADPLIANAVYGALMAFCFLASGVTAHYGMQAIHDGDKATLKGLQEFVKPHMGALMITAGLAFGLEFAGALLVVPGLVILIWVMFCGPIICEEGLKGWPAIDRARSFLSDYRWSQVVGILFVGYGLRQIGEVVPRLVTKGALLVAEEPPAAILWLNMGLGWAMNVVILASISVWISLAYTDIAALLESMPKEMMEKPTPSGEKGPGLSLKLPTDLPSLSGFSPSPKMKLALRRGMEFGMMALTGFFAWYAMKPQPLFEAPPPTIAISDVRVVAQPVLHLEGKITNNEGRTVKKAMWMVKIPPGTRGVPPAIIITNLKNGEGKPFSVPLPVNPGEPEFVPFRIEWSN